MAITKTFKKTQVSTTIEEYIDDENIVAQDSWKEKSQIGTTFTDDIPRRQIETGSTLPPINPPQNATAVSSPNPTIGKTWPDFISEQINSPRIISLLIYIISFVFFMRPDKTNTLKSLFEIPLYLGTFFNLIWFIIGPLMGKVRSLIKGFTLKKPLIQ